MLVLACLTPLQFCIYPFALYSLYVLKKHFTEQIFIKRHRWLTFYIVLFGGILVQIPRSCQEVLLLLHINDEKSFSQVFVDDGNIDSDSSFLIKVFLYCDMIHFSLWAGVMSLLSIKTWLYFWDINYSNAVFDKEWLELLDPNHSEKKWPLFLKYRFLGNAVTLLKTDLPFIILFSVSMSFLVWQQAHEWALVIFLFMLSSNGIWFVIMWCKIPKIYDSLYIRSELMRGICIFFICSIGIGILIILEISNPAGIAWQIGWSGYYLSTFASYSIVYHTVLYIVRAIVITNDDDCNSSFCNCNINGGGNQSVELAIDIDIDPVLEKETRRWMSVVSTKSAKHGYLSFMRFVTKEFANENLLFITEYLMIRKIAQEMYIPQHIVCLR